ncbi:hypothetical protein PHB09_175 [Pseudomonas phage PHB09]|uniref:Uncharacterized protein n=1 Tax=Pseudomonas phage PHB09 TaxID=2867265 RepID=A0AAE8XD35_9CAUD|nr:hypothetical protein QGX10_gp174 [Pseudomonas phage PHB09]UAV84670.1 hypothetical protein PHB09_175 [Pseudomonas phage PHB09]
MNIVFWKRKDILLGDQDVSELTILEWKKLFSLKLFHFHKTEGGQDRFHTHAFNAVSLLLKGNYTEELVVDGVITPLPRNRSRVIYIPSGQYHRITKSSGCYTLLLTGPWGKEFKELRSLGGTHYQEVFCGAGRTDLRTGVKVKLEEVE